MEKRILFETSPWFILLCLVIGLAYTIILYYRENPWEKKYSLGLGLIRFMVVSLISFLLLGPLIRQIRNQIIPPSVVFAIDNSQSIPLSYSDEEFARLKTDLSDLISETGNAETRTSVRDFEGNMIDDIDSLSFTNSKTDIEEALDRIENDYESRNLSSVILVTDGIYNQGLSPVYSNYSFPIYTLGIGDTIEKKDLVIHSLLYNKIVYQGNKFPLICELMNVGFSGSRVVVEVIKDNQVIQSRQITLPTDKGLQNIQFELEASDSGIQRYRVRVRPVANEFSLENNSQDAYVEIIEGKEKILLLAPAPHPDIKAIRNAIEKNENYEFSLVIPGLEAYKKDKYDVAIFHQIPDRRGSLTPAIDDILNENVPVFYILGTQSYLSRFNEMNHSISIRAARNQFDNVFSAENTDFALFNVDESTRTLIPDLPPVVVPFGEYTVKGDIETLLYQKVGKIVTSKPLLVINKNASLKEAVFTGEGIWQWRLHEFNEEKDFQGFDDMISKVIQYLSAREDKRKFRVYPVNNEIPENEAVLFETEIYNDLYERIYGNTVDLILNDENDSTYEYSYSTSPANSTFRISGLSPGVYQYTARTSIDGNVRQVSGMFSVRKMQLETLTLTANHSLLKELSRRSGGKYFNSDQLDELINTISNDDQKSMIISSENYMAIINMKWLFFLILLFITVEWGIRKYLGGY